MRKTRKIDIHQHYYPPAYTKRHIERIIADSPSYPEQIYLDWSPARVVENMDEWAIDHTILSQTSPGVWFGDIEAARRDVRECNDFAARVVSDHADRLSFLIALALPDIDGSLAEINRAGGAPGAKGFGVLTSYEGRLLGDPAFFPVLERLNEQNAIVFVHPTAYRGTENVANPWLIPPILEFPFDTTRAIVSLIFSGALARFPSIRFIFCHAGGAFAMLFHRIRGAAMQIHGTEAMEKIAPDGLQAILKGLYFDVVSMANPVSWPAARALFGEDQLLFGTDNPFVPTQVTVETLAAVETDERVAEKIWRGNAERLFGLKPA